MDTVTAKNRKEWSAWLEANHRRKEEIWLVFFRKGKGEQELDYEAAVKEALAYGWIDSIIKKMDDRRYARKFTPRKAVSKWSSLNKKRVEEIIRDGLMKPAGMAAVRAARENGGWDRPDARPQLTFRMHPDFRKALTGNPAAAAAFDTMTRTHQKEYLGWIKTAKHPETRERRIKESIKLLAEGKKLGLK